VWADYESIYLRDFEWDQSQDQSQDSDDYRYRNHNGPSLLKAWDFFNNKRFLTSCDECELEHLEGNAGFDEASDEASAWISDEDSDEEPTEEFCECDMFKHFVSERWLCIPCLLVEEQKAHDYMQLKKDEDGIMVS
jgi:hypothetical protein